MIYSSELNLGAKTAMMLIGISITFIILYFEYQKEEKIRLRNQAAVQVQTDDYE